MYNIEKFINGNRTNKLKIAVVGDISIDIYHYGHVSRVSPEFPVQILTSKDNVGNLCPGMASNVCHQTTHFNVDAYLLGFVDEVSASLFKEHKFNSDYCVELYSGQVPRKIRFYDSDFPLLRWDIERPNYGEIDGSELNHMRSNLFDKFRQLAECGLHAVILSDYNKGLWRCPVAQKIIEICNSKNITTLVDPKCHPLSRWKGCTVFKPNAKEAQLLTDLSDWKDQASYMMEQLQCKAVVITGGGTGVVGKCGDELFEYKVRHKSKDVNSVIGAGDCFAAILTIAMGHGLSTPEACAIAFEGGVEYVKARHNKPVNPYEIGKRFDTAAAKIMSLDELLYLKNNCYTDESFIFTNGCFDAGLTSGHIECLKYAKSLGNKLVVGINSDDSVKRLKGDKRPILTINDRAKIVSALEYVDFVIAFNEDTPLNLIKRIHPKCVVKGGEYKPEDVVGYGISEICICPHYDCMSTTKKIEEILNR